MCGCFLLVKPLITCLKWLQSQFIMLLRKRDLYCHDDFMAWKWFPQYWLTKGIYPLSVDFSQKGPAMRCFDYSLIVTLKCWINSRVLSESRYHGVTVLLLCKVNVSNYGFTIANSISLINNIVLIKSDMSPQWIPLEVIHDFVITESGYIIRRTHGWYVLLIILIHDDVIKWKHFPRNWPFVRGIHRSPVNSPHKGQWRGALVFSLICARINSWVNNGEAGDLRPYRAHCDVIVMWSRLG